MLRGYIKFVCIDCKEKFMGPDFELAATAFTASVPCPKCSGRHTRPISILPSFLSNLRYQSIWETNDRRPKEDRKKK